MAVNLPQLPVLSDGTDAPLVTMIQTPVCINKAGPVLVLQVFTAAKGTHFYDSQSEMSPH